MIDDLDKKIITELDGDARRSYTELAKVLKVSEGTIRNRVKNLQKRNIIRLEPVINPYALGYNFITMMALEVKVSDLPTVAEMLAKMPNVYYLAFVTGRYDVIAIILSKSTQELSDFIKDNISNVPGIVRSETLVNLEVRKSPWANNGEINKLINVLVKD
jgi:Lrp/AsnC family transcriptional regulator, regulator for asnA, asnC and gidA